MPVFFSCHSDEMLTSIIQFRHHNLVSSQQIFV